MKKRAQFEDESYSSITGGSPGLYGVTLHELVRRISGDQSLSAYERERLLSQIAGITQGAAPSTPIATLMGRGLGGAVGYLIAKYFSMGPVGQAVVAATGFGLGKTIYDQFNRPPPTAPRGWTQLQ